MMQRYLYSINGHTTGSMNFAFAIIIRYIYRAEPRGGTNTAISSVPLLCDRALRVIDIARRGRTRIEFHAGIDADYAFKLTW